MENLSYLFAAYSIIWLGVFIYLFSLARRQKSLEEELEGLKRRIEQQS